jgi:hypothetical protein
MKEIIEQINGLMERVAAEKQRSAYLDIAHGRLDAAAKNLGKHVEEMDKQEKARLAEIARRESELTELKEGTKATEATQAPGA